MSTTSKNLNSIPVEKKKRKYYLIPTYMAVVFYILFLGFPFLWMLSTSFKTPYELLQLHHSIIPDGLYWQNYIDIIEKRGLINSAKNSLVIALLTAALTIVFTVPAAYAIARLRKIFSGIATGWILLSQVFPVSLVIFRYSWQFVASGCSTQSGAWCWFIWLQACHSHSGCLKDM